MGDLYSELLVKKDKTTFTWEQGRKLAGISNGTNIHYYYVYFTCLAPLIFYYAHKI